MRFLKALIQKNSGKLLLFYMLTLFALSPANAQQVGILKYDGGGDWYANPTAVPNLIRFCNEQIHTALDTKPVTVSADSKDIFNYPIVFMTGHGNVYFDDAAVKNLRSYLLGGGFLHISDNYGLDPYIRRELKKVFPEKELTEIPSAHAIYHQKFEFEQLPKIHEHDGKPAQGFGIFHEGRLILFYDYECDLSDGWEDEEIHHDPYEIRIKALKMGANIVSYAFKN